MAGSWPSEVGKEVDFNREDNILPASPMKHRFRLAHLVLLASLALAIAASAEEDLPYAQAKDVIFGEIHGTGLLMDVFTPKMKTNGLAVVDVASGAWYSDRGKIRDHTLARIYPIFCSRGYTVFAVRPGSKTRYTVADMDQNLKTAIRFIKEHAKDYGIDPDRLGLTGASAGGHLATLAALTPEEGKPESKSSAKKFSTRVKAVAVFFPPTDFLEWEEGKPPEPSVVGPLLYVGGVSGHSDEEIRAKAREASPLHRVDKPSVPFLLIHGDADRVVPLSHSQKLVDAIKRAGGSAELIVKKGGGHAWLTMFEEVGLMADWFDKALGSQAASVASP